MIGVSLVLLVASTALVSGTVPDYLKLCQRNDPNIADCITNSVYALLPHLKRGIPELNVPPLEPLKLQNVALDSGTEAASIKATLRNITVFNGSVFDILENIPNIQKNRFRFKVRVPSLHIKGNYQIDAKILFLQIKGDGPFEINITNYEFDCVMQGHKIKQDDGQDHLLFDKMKLDIGFSKGSIWLYNLFNGDPVLGKATNDVINENIEIFFSEMKPAFQEGISSTFTDIANAIAKSFTYDELFPLKE